MKTLMLAVALLVASPVLAQQGEGHSGGNGESPVSVSEKQVQKFISVTLRSRIRQVVRNMDPSEVKNLDLHTALKELLSRGLEMEAINAPYILKSKCVDSNGEMRPTASKPGEVGGGICFDLKKLVASDVSEAQLTALTLSEHALHLGYDDKDGALQRYVVEQLAPQEESK